MVGAGEACGTGIVRVFGMDTHIHTHTHTHTHTAIFKMDKQQGCTV